MISRVESNPEGFERLLGHEITDENGHINDITGVLRELADYGRRGRGQQKRLMFTFGYEGSAALRNTDFGAIRGAEEVQPSSAGAEAQQRLQHTPAGERRQTQIQKDIAMQRLVGHDSLLGGLADAFGRFAAEHPIGAVIGANVGTRLLGQAVKVGTGLLRGGAGALASAGSAGTAATGTVAAEEGLLGTGALSGFSATSASEGVVAIGGAGAASLGAAGGGLLGSGFLLYKYLRAMALANSRQWGFGVRDIGAGEASALAAKAQTADSEAATHRSPGLQAAYEAERGRLERQRAQRSEAAVALPPAAVPPGRQSQAALAPLPGSGAGSTTDSLYKSTVDQLVKAGASLALAQETAAAILRDQRTPVQITVINATGGSIEAAVRGDQ